MGAGLRTVCGFFMACTMATAWSGEFYGRVGGGAAYDDNVSHGPNNLFRRGDFSYRVGGAAGANWLADERIGLTLEAQVDGNQFQRFERLSYLHGALLARALFKPFEGYGAPWFALESEAGVVGHKDSPLRDHWEWSGRALTGTRLTDRLSTSLGYQFTVQRGSQDQIWNGETHALLAGAQYALMPQVTLYVDYQLSVGKHTASAPAGPASTVFPSTRSPSLPSYDRVSRDKALEADTGQRVYAYRLDGTSHLVAVGGSWSVSHDWALDLSGRYYALDGEAGAFYEGLGANAGVSYQF